MKKTAIITGASRGIGYAIAERLGRDGCNVVILATGEQARYQEALDRLTDQGIDWLYVQGSVDSAQSREKLVCETVNHYGRIDILVNNAGVAPKERRDLLEMTEESFDRVMNINAKANLFLTQLVARQMIAQKQVFANKGHICQCGILLGGSFLHFPRGILRFQGGGLDVDHAVCGSACRRGYRCQRGSPGVIATDMTSVVTEKYDKLIADGAFPIARWGRPEDVADMVSLFCSDRVLYTTGNYVDVDGGFHIKRL